MTNEEVDALLGAPAVVFGSLPPDNRDLDLLVEAGERQRLIAALVDRGWTMSGRTAASFAGGTAFAVDVMDLDEWAPSSVAAASLREESVLLAGFEHLHAPAPHHRLLIQAQRHAAGAPLTDARRAVVAGFLAADWDAAEHQADAWHALDALRALRVVMTSGDAPSTRVRRLRRPHRRRVIALSGVDGAGKSTHAEHLARALDALGYETTTAWTKLTRDPVLDVISGPVKRALSLVSRHEPAPSSSTTDDDVDEFGEVRHHLDGRPPPPSRATRVRQGSTVLTWGWSIVVVAANAIAHRRATAQPPRVVVCDRYVLDSMAHVRYGYPAARVFGVQRALLRAVSPRPAAAFLLDVAPEEARRRKPEQYTTSDLTKLRRLYHDEARRLEVVVVDAAADELDVAASVARAAWLRLENVR
ncbi:MAG: hypothetical protein QOD30_1618 [Actinomycetota bacterium]|jgi:thymidylate kinase|nr:hypothetical protein [Actinomycetota bacterium]